MSRGGSRRKALRATQSYLKRVCSRAYARGLFPGGVRPVAPTRVSSRNWVGGGAPARKLPDIMHKRIVPVWLVLAMALLTGCAGPEVSGRERLAAEVLLSERTATYEAISAEEALARLKAGNARFVASAYSSRHPVAEARMRTVSAQYPYAVVVGCSDSRAPAEIVFDENLGSIFGVRTAGNLVDDYGLGSIEYAVEHLGTRLIVVMGHEHCGAVKAAISGTEASGYVADIVRGIEPAVVLAGGFPGDVVTNVAEANARLVADKIRREADFDGHRVKVVPAIYDLETGEVRWLD